MGSPIAVQLIFSLSPTTIVCGDDGVTETRGASDKKNYTNIRVHMHMCYIKSLTFNGQSGGHFSKG